MSNKFRLAKKAISKPERIPPYILNNTSIGMELQKYNVIFNAKLSSQGASLSPTRPDIPETEKSCKLQVLQTEKEYQSSVDEIRSLGLHPHPDLPKNWDALCALKRILLETEPDDRILSAGGATYSPLIEWLYLYGYEDLYVQNIDFKADFQRGPIQYQDADFTEPQFEYNSVDVIECLSVIEHGVPLRSAFRQFHRILKPGGILVISTDYWKKEKDMADKKTNYGESEQEWRIFNEEGIEEVLKIAGDVGFSLPKKRDYSTEKQPVTWKGENYTFLYFELKKQETG